MQFAEYLKLFTDVGHTDIPYLKHHYIRYLQTKQRVLQHWDFARGNRVLDIGAHWLHQSLMYAVDRFDVTALDFPITLELSEVKAVAQRYDIALLANENLENPIALLSEPENSFDLVLFTEIIEHITFNPVAMWRQIYRVLKPGGRIVVTTPNYYAWRGRCWEWKRFRQGFGGGISALDILTKRTYAHHWKEYALRELIYYFCVLSPDFNCVHWEYVEEYQEGYVPKPANRYTRKVEKLIPVFRPDIYLEVEIAKKDKGIVVEPQW